MNLRHKFYKLFKKGEYAAASFYCREWLRHPNTPEGEFFKSLFEDEFLHWRFFAKLLDEAKIKSNVEAREKFINQQKEIVQKGDPKVGSFRSYLTNIKDTKYDFQMVGFSSRFLVYQKMLGNRFTKDLKGENKVGFIKVIDESNHLMYKLVNLLDWKQDYSFLWRHPHKVDYYVPKQILWKWSIRYIKSIVLYLPIDLYRIARSQF